MKIGVVGLGLIGGSLARQIMRNTEHTVYAYDISDEVLKKGALLNAYHEVLDINKEKLDLDLLIIATNPRATLKLLETLTPKLKSGAIIFDCAGVKKDIIKKITFIIHFYNQKAKLLSCILVAISLLKSHLLTYTKIIYLF